MTLLKPRLLLASPRGTRPARILWLPLLFATAMAGWLAVDTTHERSRAAAGAPAGYVSDAIVSGLSLPMDVAFAPDGRIFIAEKGGAIRIVKDGALLPAPFAQLNVNTFGSRGLIGMALSPDFETDQYLFVYYTHEHNPDDPQGRKFGRISRLTANGDVVLPGSEVVLVGTVISGNRCQDHPPGTDCLAASNPDHVAGGMRFASDGTLYVAVGDDQDGFNQPQNLDRLNGKILRLNPDGTGPADNPFYTGNPDANRSKIWAYGLRNPFRFGVQPGSDLPIVGDVGQVSWEEIDAVVAGGNYGWPCYEGLKVYEPFSEFSFCQALYQSGTARPPFYTYPLPPSAAVIGGPFYQGSNYPQELDGAYIFGDNPRSTISSLRLDAGNQLVAGSVMQLIDNADGPVDIEVGPDGNIYYLALFPGELRRLRFGGAPVAEASADVTSGPPPLTVQFSSAGSLDPEGGPLEYQWEFDDGSQSDEENPEHTFTQEGTYLVTLTVSDEDSLTGGDAISIRVGDAEPVATILAPPHGFVYDFGETIDVQGYGIDLEDGNLPSSSLHWTITLIHCHPGSDCHPHPYLEFDGDEGTFIAPSPHPGDEADIFYLEIELAAEDSSQLVGTDGVTISPDADGDGLSDIDEFLLGTNHLLADTDADGCTDSTELGPNEYLGGRRNPLNPWDFFDTDHNGTVDLFIDILGVAAAFGQTPADSGYDVSLDRSGPPSAAEEPDPAKREPWDLGPPDGSITLFTDVFGAAMQFGHGC